MFSFKSPKKIPVTLPPYGKTIKFIKAGIGTDWSHDFYDIKKLHEEGKRGAGVKIAVLDTGVDLSHGCFKKAVEEGRLKAFDTRRGQNDPNDGNGHGCVTPDTLIHTTLCGMNRIETFFDRVSNLDKITTENELVQGSITYEPKTSLYTTSWNGKEFIKDQVTHVHKFPYEGELVVVKTKDTTLRLTPWHPVYTVSSTRGKEMTVVKKRADELSIEDKILCANSTDINETNYRYVNGYLLNEDLAYFAGLIFSDGHLTKKDYRVDFTNNNPILVENFKILSKKIFNKETGKEQGTTTPLYLKDAWTTLVELGIPVGNKSKTVTLPEIITKSPLSVITSFYSGVIDGDGNISEDRVRVISASEDFCKATIDLMQILGYNASYSVNSTKGFKNDSESICYAIRMPNLNYIGFKRASVKDNIRRSRSILSISSEEYKGNLYDLTIKDSHNYVSTSGLIVSNTWCVSRYIGSGVDVLGFAPDCTVHSYKVLDENGSGNLSDVLNGVKAAMKDKCHIISTSLGWSGRSRAFNDIANQAFDQGILWVSASGNDGRNEDIDYPALYNKVISIGSHDENRLRSYFSDFGEDLDIYSSGEKVLGAYTKNREAVLQGTSMATPSLGALVATVYFDIIGKYGKIDREVLKNLVTCR